MLKVLHTESSIGWGGQEIRIVEECSWFNKNKLNIRCSILASNRSQFLLRADLNSVDVRLGPIEKKSLRGLLFVWNILASQKPDVVVTHSSTDSWLVTLATQLLSVRPKIIRMRHISAPISSSYLTKWMYRQATYVVTTSRAIKQHVHQQLGIPQEQIFDIPTGLDVDFKFKLGTLRNKLEARSNLRLPKSPIVLAMLSTLRSWKGHSYVLDALDRFPNAVLLIGGDGPQEGNLKRIVLQKGMAHRVIFLGFLKDPLPLLMAADIFIQPSYANEGLSQSLMQAMAVGLPVVASDIGGLNEMVVDGRDGILVAPKDVDQLTVALGKLIENTILRATLGQAARARAEQSFSIDKMGAKMAIVLEKFIT